MSDKQPSKTGRGSNLPNGPGHGRPKGVPNKNTKALKDMILGALEAGGGQKWLLAQMEANPVAFMGLVGKVLPSELRVGNPDGSPFTPDTARRMVGLQEGDE